MTLDRARNLRDDESIVAESVQQSGRLLTTQAGKSDLIDLIEVNRMVQTVESQNTRMIATLDSMENVLRSYGAARNRHAGSPSAARRQ